MSPRLSLTQLQMMGPGPSSPAQTAIFASRVTERPPSKYLAPATAMWDAAGRTGLLLTASADGSSVLLSNGKIYGANGVGTAYEYSGDLTQGQGGFLGIAGQSEDLSHLYFVDTANLTGGEENGQGAVAEAGKPNLYSLGDENTHFVATLSSGDGNQEKGDWVAAPSLITAEASPSGRWAAFLSVAPLTGFENLGRKEVFLYDSQTRELTCASCNPSGARPVGDAVLPINFLSQARYLTDAGRLFFDTGDRLVPGDTNGKVEDVYEHEPQGMGGCSRPDGCLHLISSGRGSSDSNFLTMDETGDNVFFTTGNRLVAADKDELIDLYDARVGGRLLRISAAGRMQGGSVSAGSRPACAADALEHGSSRRKQRQAR